MGDRRVCRCGHLGAATLVVALVLPPGGALQAVAEPAGPRSAFQEWAAARSIPLPSLAPTPELTRYLDRALAGKRVVLLGEPDHYIEEKKHFRLLFLRYLFERGWRHVGLEGVGEAQARRINRYLESGRKRDLRRGDFTEPDFTRRLREVASGLPVRVFSFDVETRSSAARREYDEIRRLLGPHAADPLAAETLRLVTQARSVSLDQEVRQADALARRVDARPDRWIELLGAETYRELRASTRCLRDSLVFLAGSGVGGNDLVGLSDPAWVRSLVARERVMCDRMREVLRRRPPDEKLVLLGHDMHLSKDSSRLRFAPLGARVPPMWTSIGTCLQAELGERLFAIWLLVERGSHFKPAFLGGSMQPTAFESPPATVNAELGRVGERFLLPLGDDERNGLLDGEAEFVINGDHVVSGVIGDQVDALLFIRRVNAVGAL